MTKAAEPEQTHVNDSGTRPPVWRTADTRTFWPRSIWADRRSRQRGRHRRGASHDRGGLAPVARPRRRT